MDGDAPIDERHEACFVMVTNPVVGRKAYLIGGVGWKNTNSACSPKLLFFVLNFDLFSHYPPFLCSIRSHNAYLVTGRATTNNNASHAVC